MTALAGKLISLFAEIRHSVQGIDLGDGAVKFDIRASRNNLKDEVAPHSTSFNKLVKELRNRLKFWRDRI